MSALYRLMCAGRIASFFVVKDTFIRDSDWFVRVVRPFREVDEREMASPWELP